jgi:hypothetical protein
MALVIAVTAVAVERFINKRRIKLHEVLADVGWLTLLFAFIEFAYLFVVEALTLNFGALARPLWHTEWGVFKALLLEAAVGALLILTSVWIESAGVRVELRRPSRFAVAARRALKPPPPQGRQEGADTAGTQRSKCDIEWREAA